MSESEEKTLASTIAQEIRAVLEEDASRRKTERDAAEGHIINHVKSSPWPKTVAGWLTLVSLVIATMIGVAGFLSDYFDMRRKADMVPVLTQRVAAQGKLLDARGISIEALERHAANDEIHQTKWQKMAQIRETVAPLKADSVARDRKIDNIQTQLKVATDGIKEIKQTLKELRNR